MRKSNSRVTVRGDSLTVVLLAAIGMLTAAPTSKGVETGWISEMIAVPERAKLIAAQNGVDWCQTVPSFRSRYPIVETAACPTEGDCDIPANRDGAVPSGSTPVKYVRIKFNVFRNDDGSSPAASQSDVDAQMVQLNADFAPSRIQFSALTEFINSTTFRSYADLEETAMKAAHADQPAAQLNVYVVNIEEGYLGIGTFPWDPNATATYGGLIIDDEWFGAGQKTLTHEVGHCLGLWHTHRGVTEVTGCDGCREWAGASASARDITGDFASDTDPTPVNYTCSGPGGTDECSGGAWGATDPQNYMGYASDSCYTEFSPHQMGRMHCWTSVELSTWLVPAPEGLLQFGGSGYSIPEPGGVMTVSVSRVSGSVGAVTVGFTTSNGTAMAGSDYTTTNGTLSWGDGDSTPKTFEVSITDDGDVELTESGSLVLMNPMGGASLGSPSTVEFTILDDEAGDCVNIVEDPSFEAGNPWPLWTVQSSTAFGSPLCDGGCGDGGGTAGPWGGANFAWFGGIATAETATLGQAVTIPPGQATLYYYLWIGSVVSPFTDTLTVKLDGNTLDTHLEPSTAEPGYTRRSVDVSAYADGGSHALLFEYVGPPDGGTANFCVDDVVLTVCPESSVGITAGADAYGTTMPSGIVQVVSGSCTSFTISADSYYHISQILTNGDDVAGASGLAETNFTWCNITSPGSIWAYFDVNLAASNTPEWWLASFGLTNNFDLEALNDHDNDGLLTWQEWICRTDPTNASSVLTVSNVVVDTESDRIIRWQSAPDRLYTIRRLPDLVSGTSSNIATGVPATPPVNVHTDSVGVTLPVFYDVLCEDGP